MSITKESELIGMQKAAKAVAERQMIDYTRPGISTKELDEYGAQILAEYGARSAPYLTYGFPGWSLMEQVLL